MLHGYGWLNVYLHSTDKVVDPECSHSYLGWEG